MMDSRRSTGRASAGARVGLVVFALLVLAALTLSIANGSWNLEITVQLVAFASFAIVGAVLLEQVGHRIGWICLVIGLGGVVNGLAQEVLRYTAAHPGAPGATAALALQLLFGFPATGLAFTFLPLLFPDGRLPSARWQPVAWLAVADLLTLVVAGGFTTPGLFATGPNPFSIIPAGPASDAVTTGAGILTIITGCLCASALAVRFRRVGPVERQQLKWVAAAVTLFAASLVFSILFTPIDTFAWLLPLLPISVGIAILRYRLYDIDVIIGRALVYVPLTALLAGLYAASVALFQRLFVAVTGNQSDAAVIITTLILASLFTPARKWLEGIVERRFRPTTGDPASFASAGAPPAAVLSDHDLDRRIERIARRVAREVVAETRDRGPRSA